jgi:hypothetical protein
MAVNQEQIMVNENLTSEISTVYVMLINMYTNVEWVMQFSYTDDADLNNKIKEYIAEKNKISPQVIKLSLVKIQNNYKAYFSYYLR